MISYKDDRFSFTQPDEMETFKTVCRLLGLSYLHFHNDEFAVLGGYSKDFTVLHYLNGLRCEVYREELIHD